MEFIEWGLIEYIEATQRQLEFVDQVAGGGPERIVFCKHPAIVTLGRASDETDLLGWSGAQIETSRGGRATYHGPSQLVIYPILDLKKQHKTFGPRDLHAYMRSLEAATCKALTEIGIKNAGIKTGDAEELSFTGVWVGERKIASIGIAVRKWISYHGCAINIEKDPLAFTGIQPCGFTTSTMTNVEEILGEPHRNELTRSLKSALAEI